MTSRGEGGLRHEQSSTKSRILSSMDTHPSESSSSSLSSEEKRSIHNPSKENVFGTSNFANQSANLKERRSKMISIRSSLSNNDEKRVPFPPPSKDGIAKSINKNILLGIKNDNNNLTDRNEDPVGIVIKDNNSEDG